MDRRDKALCTELFYGVLRWRLRLDTVLERHARKGVPSDPELANLLRMGLYQLIVTDRIPPRAAVDTTVTLARKARGQKVAGFVNGLLRGVLRDGAEPQSLAERWGHPEWLVTRLQAQLGDGLEARLEANMTSPPITLRMKSGAKGPNGALPTSVPGVVDASSVATAAVRKGTRKGWWLPQDPASARVVALLDPQPGEAVLELCGGRGVKTSQIAECVGTEGRIVTVDSSAAKLADGQRLVSRWAPGVPHYSLAARADLSLPLVEDQRFDRVLIDAPCSGLGTIRRRPETLWRRVESDITELAALQAAILAEAWKWLKPGGTLVYAVCTDTPEETREIVAQYTVLDSFASAPERDGCDGFYAARLAL